MRQLQIERQYEHLLLLGRQRTQKLQDSCDMHRLNRETGEFAQWLEVKQDLVAEMVENVKENPELLNNKDTLENNLEALKQELKAKEGKIDELMKLADRLKENNQNAEAQLVCDEIERQRKSLDKFKKYVESVEQRLTKANELNKFKLDSTDTLDWINEKKQILDDQNYGSFDFIFNNNLIICNRKDIKLNS